MQALQQGLESVLSTFCHTAKQQARLAYVYLIEVELYIAKEVISFPSVLHNSHYIVAGIWIKDGQGIAGAAGMPTLFFGCLTLALLVPFPADRGPADEQPELYCKHATRAVACRHIGPIVANPTMHFEGPLGS